jgi:hypothetical protein
MLKTDVFYIHTWKYKNESVDIVLRGWGGQWERMVEAENLRYIKHICKYHDGFSCTPIIC